MQLVAKSNLVFPSGLILAAATLSASILYAGIASAAETSPPSAKPAAPVETLAPQLPISGALVICGGGSTPDEARNRFLQLAGGSKARIVLITTAGQNEESPDTDLIERNLTPWRTQPPVDIVPMHTLSRQKADLPEFVRPLEQATGVWFTGGYQWRIADTYLGTRVEQALQGILKRGGVIGGTSAGAAVLSTVMIRRGRPEVEAGPGFGLLPGTLVDQHFTQRSRAGRLERLLAAHPQLTGVGIDEDTAAIVSGRSLEVVGGNRVTVYSRGPGNRVIAPSVLAQPVSRPAPVVLEHGQRFDLVELKPIASPTASRQ